MNSIYSILFAIILASSNLLSADYMLEDFKKDIESYNKPKSVEAYEVNGVFFQKDEAGITLMGKIFFMKNFRNEYLCAYFKGEMNFSLYPPVKYEREQLVKVDEEEYFEKDLSEAFFFFIDDFKSFIEQNGTKINPTQGDLDGMNGDFVLGLKKFLIGKKSGTANPNIGDVLLNYRQGYFQTVFKDDKRYWFYTFSPYDQEEVLLGYGIESTLYDDGVFGVVNFDRKEDYSLRDQDRVRRMSLDYDVVSYDMDIEIDKDLELHGDVKMTTHSDSTIFRWTYFRIDPVFTIDTIYVNGVMQKFDFVQQYGLITLYMGEDQKLDNDIRFIYHGKVLNRIQDFIEIRSFTGWYPTTSLLYYEPSIYKMNFKVPDNYKFVAPGKRISEREDDDHYYSSWVTDSNAIHTTFSMGPYRTSTLEKEGMPEIDLYFYNYGNIKETELDLAQSYQFYSGLYGDLGFDRIYATEIYSGHGQAFSNFLHLSFANFAMGSSANEEEMVSFVSHEMAHQWWGGGMKPLSPRDTWLSEGFAEYSSHLYTQLVLGDNEKFFKLLLKKQQNLIESRKKKDFVPSLIMGTRAGRNYQLLVYEKGCWVNHMLRNLMVDLNTFNEDAYKAMMKEFFQTFKFQRASTEDFKVVVDKYWGDDSQWFFDQWVYGSEIPKYTFSYKYDETENGKHQITCKVKQENVSEGFKMLVPIKIDFGDKGTYRLRVWIDKEENIFKLPVFDMKPEQVVFNDLQSVLCEFEEAKWED